MGIWRAAYRYEVCGYDRAPIPADDPVQVLRGKLIRCEQHAHEPIDWAQVERSRRERAETRQPDPTVRRVIQAAPRFRRVSELLDVKTRAAGDHK